MNKLLQKSKIEAPAPEILYKILQEVQALREDILSFLPHEDLDQYAHPARIKRSYQKALKQHMPTPWR